MNQPDLFDVGDRDINGNFTRDSRGRLKRPRTLCVPAQLGTGPKGETCRSCKHYVRRIYSKPYRKCGLMRRLWTRGAATDIKASWPACGRWEQPE